MNKLILGLIVVSLVMFGCGKKQAQEEVVVTEEAGVTNRGAQTPVEPEVVEMPVQSQAQEQAMVEKTAFVKPAIKDVQQALKNAGFDVSVDGKSGPKTKQAIKDFQTKSDLKADGNVGPQTWKKLQQYLNAVQQ